MSWQKIRKQLRDLWHPEIAKNLDVHVARYRKSGVWDDLGRVSFVYRKEEIFVLSDSEDWKRCWHLFDMSRADLNFDSRASAQADQLGYYDVERFYELTNLYLNELNISQVFDSKILLFQIYAILDRRVGKRTLEKKSELIDSNETLNMFRDIRLGFK